LTLENIFFSALLDFLYILGLSVNQQQTDFWETLANLAYSKRKETVKVNSMDVCMLTKWHLVLILNLNAKLRINY